MPHRTCITHIKAATAHTVPLKIPIVDAIAHAETAIVHIEAVTTHVHPFEPTVTTHEKIAKPF